MTALVDALPHRRVETTRSWPGSSRPRGASAHGVAGGRRRPPVGAPARLRDAAASAARAVPASLHSHRSFWSLRSMYSGVSIGSFASLGSVLSAGSFGSVASLGSTGSILSIGSAGSILSIGSAGSMLSIGSVGSILAIGGAGVHNLAPSRRNAPRYPGGLSAVPVRSTTTMLARAVDGAATVAAVAAVMSAALRP